MIDNSAFTENYIKHDINAFCGSDQIQDLTSRIGLAGYGAYWVIVEWLYRSETHRLAEGNIHGLAYSMHISDDELLQIIAVLRDCGLLVKDETTKSYFSNRVDREINRRKEEKQQFIDHQRMAGRASGQARQAKTNTSKTMVEPRLNHGSTPDCENRTMANLNEEKRSEENRREVNLSKEDGSIPNRKDDLTDRRIDTSTFSRLNDEYGRLNVAWALSRCLEQEKKQGKRISNLAGYIETTIKSGIEKGLIQRWRAPTKPTTATQLYNGGVCPHCGEKLDANACRSCGCVWTFRDGSWVEEKLADPSAFAEKLRFKRDKEDAR